MQYCTKCRVQIRGRKARCPLCQGELLEALPPGGVDYAALREDPFARISRSPVTSMLLFRIVTFLCVSALIFMGAIQVISGFRLWWVHVACLGVLAGWADVLIALYYRSNILKMLNTQAYLLMAVSIVIDRLTTRSGWSVSWFIPILFVLLVLITNAVAAGNGLHLYEFILYLALDVVMSLLQIIPIALGWNKVIAPAVICIALMLVLASSLIIFQGKMLRSAVSRYLHI